MRRILRIAILALLPSVIPMTAQSARTFYLATATRVDNFQLPRGICEVTWDTTSASRVRLTIKTEDRKTHKVVARIVDGNQGRMGVVTSVVDGVTYLQELHTANQTFIFQMARKVSK